MIIIVSISITAIIVFVLCSILEFKESVDERCVAISFDEFLAFYNSAPHKWRLDEDYVKYSIHNNLCPMDSERIYFKSYHDYRKYKKWRRKLEKKSAG